MSSKDESVFSKESLLTTKPGKDILKEGFLKGKGYKQFDQYKKFTQNEFPKFVSRFTNDLLEEIKKDDSPQKTINDFANEMDSQELLLDGSKISNVKSTLQDYDSLSLRVQRILDSNFVKMTLPVFNALFDASVNYFQDSKDSQLKSDIVDGHIMAIDLSEPMDRIIDKDEDLEFLDDYKLMNPYILRLARSKISKGGEQVLSEFEHGFREARVGQKMDYRLKTKPTSITEEEMHVCYKKYRAIMGTAGKNMSLCKSPLNEIFYLGMSKAGESVGCGNEIEDSIRNGSIKVPSWPLYYANLSDDVELSFDLAVEKSNVYLKEARIALELLPPSFTHKEFLEFLFQTVEHFTRYWYNQLKKKDMWNTFRSNMQDKS